MRHFKIKNIFSYVVVAALITALSISCKSNEEPSGPNAGTNPSEGNYTSRIAYNNKVGDEKPSATVTHNADGGCTITGKLGASSNKTGTILYKLVDFRITVNSWYESNYGGAVASHYNVVVNSPSGSPGGISWGYSDDGTAHIDLQIFWDDGYVSSDILYFGN